MCSDLLLLLYAFYVAHVSVSVRYSEIMLGVECVCQVQRSVSVNFSKVLPSVHGLLVMFCSVSYTNYTCRWWQKGQCGDGAVAANWRSGQSAVYLELGATLFMRIGATCS